MCNSIEWGRCEICGKETQLERTYFYYPIHCECCGNKENRHFEMIRHCKKCPAPMPKEIHPLCKAMDGVFGLGAVVKLVAGIIFILFWGGMFWW